MNPISSSVASLSEQFDSEAVALLRAVVDGIEIPEFNADLDVFFGTPLDMYEAGELPHECLADLDDAAAIEAIKVRHGRLLAAGDITIDDPAIALNVRHRLVDILLPYASQLRIAPPTAADSAPLAA